MQHVFDASLALGRSWVPVILNIWSVTVCLLLRAETVILLVCRGLQLDLPWFFIVSVLCSAAWPLWASNCCLSSKGSNKWINIFVYVLVCALAGLLVAIPAFIGGRMHRSMPKHQNVGLTLGDYLSCEKTSVPEKKFLPQCLHLAVNLVLQGLCIHKHLCSRVSATMHGAFGYDSLLVPCSVATKLKYLHKNGVGNGCCEPLLFVK